MRNNLFIILGLLLLLCCKKETDDVKKHQDYKLSLIGNNTIIDTPGKVVKFSFSLSYNDTPYYIQPFSYVHVANKYTNNTGNERLYISSSSKITGELDVYFSIPLLSEYIEIEIYLTYQGAPITDPIKLILRQKPEVKIDWTFTKIPSFKSMLQLTDQTYCYYVFDKGIVYSNASLDSVWQISNYNPNDITFTFLGKTSTGNILAKNYTNRLYVSNNNGATFERRIPNLNNSQLVCLIDDQLYATSMASLHVSNDEGVSWQELNKGYEITTLKKLSTEKLVCLTKDNNVYTMSKNTDTLFNITPPNNSVLFIAVLDGIIYIFNSKNQLLKSTDLGLTWNGIGTISSEYYVSDMQILNNRFHFSLANQYTKHLITKGLTDLTPTTIQTKASYNNGTFIPISNNRVLSLTSSLPAMVKIIP